MTWMILDDLGYPNGLETSMFHQPKTIHLVQPSPAKPLGSQWTRRTPQRRRGFAVVSRGISQTRPGKLTVSYGKWPMKIDGLALLLKMGGFSIAMLNYQRVSTKITTK